MPPPRCRAGWSCCATRRSLRARRTTCSWCSERPLAGGRRRPLRHSRHLVEPHRRRRHVHRSARARAAAAHARAPRRDRSAGAARSCRGLGARARRVQADGSISTPSFAIAPSAPPERPAFESDLALVVLPAKAGRAAMLAADLGAAARAHRPDARRLPCRAAGSARASASSSCARGRSPRLPAPIFLAAVRKLAEAGEIALDRTWVRRPGHQVRFSAGGGADLGADPAAPRRRALSAAARARYRQGHEHR